MAVKIILSGLWNIRQNKYKIIFKNKKLFTTIILLLTILITAKPITIKSIDFYQHYISPYKGWSCAYRILHKKESACSCSEFAKRSIKKEGLIVGLYLLNKRFKDCSESAITLQTIYETHRSLCMSNISSSDSEDCDFCLEGSKVCGGTCDNLKSGKCTEEWGKCASNSCKGCGTGCFDGWKD